MKALFLDIDGVLNSHRTVIAFGGYPHGLTGTARGMFDEVAIGLISGIAEASGAKIVLSSSWRNDENWLEIGPALGLQITDRTPSCLGPRGQEIAQWLKEHPEVESYAIVDDDGDMLEEQKPFFVHTSHYEGLTFANAEHLAALLGIAIYDVRAPRLRKPIETLEWMA